MNPPSSLRLSSRLLLPLLSLSLSLHGPASCQEPPTPPAAPVRASTAPPASHSDLATKVDAIAAKYLARPGAVGLTIGIARGGAVVLERGYGKAELEFDVAVDPATMFRIGSVTKQFTAALVVRAAERDLLSLDDPLARYVPSFATDGQTVTIRQLLQHTSGIPNYTDVGAAWERQQPLELTDDELLAFVAGKPLDFAPGTDWRYSNTGYYLLGMVLAKVFDKSYATLVVDELAAPLGLARTRYDSNSEVIRNRAQGYAMRDGVLGNDDLLGTSQPGAAGALLSTGGDLVRWSMALAQGKVVSADGYAMMTTPCVLPSGRDTHYGFGLGTLDYEGHRCIRHGGGINGFNSVLTHFPDDDLHIAVISNGERLNSGRLGDELADALLGVTKVVAKDLPIEPALLDAIVGSYRIADLDMELRVFAEAGKVMVQATGQGAFRALWQGEDLFRAEFDHKVKLVFAADRQSFELHQGGGVFVARRQN